MNRRHFMAAAMAASLSSGAAFAQDFGKPAAPVTMVVGYQPYYTQSWSGVVMRAKKFYEKYLPQGSKVEFQIGLQEVGVHFVLEGSVRRAGNRVRITVQLVNGETGQHVWAERYEDVLSDVFDPQERITR